MLLHAFAVLVGGLAGNGAEEIVEVALVHSAEGEGDGGNGQIGVLQQTLGLGDGTILHDSSRGKTHRDTHSVGEHLLGHAELFGVLPHFPTLLEMFFQ